MQFLEGHCGVVRETEEKGAREEVVCTVGVPHGNWCQFRLRQWETKQLTTSRIPSLIVIYNMRL